MQTCPDECVMCRYERHVPAEPDRYGILETIIGGAGIGFFLWAGFALAYALGAIVVKAGAAGGSLVVSLAVGALLAIWPRMRR
jgi:hypothetical protein